MTHLHEMVVDDIGQVVGRQFVGTLVKHLIIEDITLDNHLTTDHVVYMHLLTGCYHEAHHILLSVGNQFIHLFLRQCQGVAHHTTGMGIVLEILDLGTLSLQFLGGIESDIRLTISQQLVYIFLIDMSALTLSVRTILAAEGYTLVEFNA